jgi:hypothetical protein
MLGGAAQRNLAQRDQVALAKEVLRGALGLLGQIDLARFQARQQFVGRHVHQDDFVRLVQHRVGHGLVHTDAGDGTYRAVEAFQMLHIHGRPDVDARVQQFLHVLPAFGVARTLYVGVRQLVHQQHRRLARQRGVQVKLGQVAAAVRHVTQGQHRQAGQQFGGFATAVGFHNTHQHLAAGLVLALRRAQHGVGFADTRAGAEVNTQLAAAIP